MVSMPAGAYSTAVTASDVQMTPIAGRCESLRLMTTGPMA